ncbi:hypothetical protein UlMin_005650 [Ulmus minor]
MANGNFTAKSAYLTANKNCIIAYPYIPKEIWLRLWGHKSILPRHKLNWWLFISNCLPTREKLNSIFAIDDITCPIYNIGPENAIHVLFLCDFSRHLWVASPWNLRTENIVCNSTLECIKFLWLLEDRDSNTQHAEDGSRNIFLFASVLMDFLWKHRNDTTHGSPKSDPTKLYASIMRSYYSILAGCPSLKPKLSFCWTPPPTDWLKINFDAAIKDSSASIACVAHANDNSILRWSIKKVTTDDPLVAKCLAAEMASDIARSMGWNVVLLEGDCMKL